jgi:Na+-transporting methylmalonyl-CoA/oxaloacetate decarboxylase gamma subunit
MSLETLMMIGMVLVVLLAIIAVVSYLVSQQAGASAPPATITPETVAVQEADPSSTAATTMTTSVPTLSATKPAADPAGEVTLTLEATEHVWVSVTRDTRTVFEGMMAPGQPKSWTGQEAIGVKTGNGAALQVTVNGQAQGPMGGRNQISSRAWGPKGELTTPEASVQ